MINQIQTQISHESVNKTDCVCVNTSDHVSASIIWLHGLGADNTNFLDIIPLLNIEPQSGVRFMFPNAPHRAITMNAGMHMRAWYDIYDLDKMSIEDKAGILESEAIIHDLIDHEKSNHNLNSDQIILAGFSQGGAMSLFSGLRYHEKIAGILALSCYLPLESEVQNATDSENAKTPTLLMHGNNDPVIPLHAAKLTHDALASKGFSSELKTDNYEHELPIPQIQQIGNWLKSTLD